MWNSGALRIDVVSWVSLEEVFLECMSLLNADAVLDLSRRTVAEHKTTHVSVALSFFEQS